MTAETGKVFDAALALSSTDRVLLAEQLLESLEPEPWREVDQAAVDAAWADECERRYKAYKNGEMGSTPGEQVMRELREKYMK